MPQMQIKVGAPLHERVERSLEAIVAAQDQRLPDVMVRGSELVRMADEGLRPFSDHSLSERLSRDAALRQGGQGRRAHRR